MTRQRTRSAAGRCQQLLTFRIFDALKSYGLPQALNPLMLTAQQYHGIGTVREIAELLTAQAEPDSIPDDKLGLTWTLSYTRAKSPADLERYQHLLNQPDNQPPPELSTIDPLAQYDDTEREIDTGEYIETEGLGTVLRVLIELHISDPNNWHVRHKVRLKAKPLTKQLQNNGSVDRIKVIVNGLHRKLLVPKRGHRTQLAAIARIIHTLSPDISFRRAMKVLRALFERSGHVIVTRKGNQYLADFLLLPYPVNSADSE